MDKTHLTDSLISDQLGLAANSFVEGDVSLDILNLSYDAGRHYLSDLNNYIHKVVQSKSPPYLATSVPFVEAFVSCLDTVS